MHKTTVSGPASRGHSKRHPSPAWGATLSPSRDAMEQNLNLGTVATIRRQEKRLDMRDLRPGDILLTVDSHTPSGLALRGLMSIAGRRKAVTSHASIVKDAPRIIESVSSGLEEADLNRRFRYYVYRHQDPELAATAVRAAELMGEAHAAQGSVPYAVGSGAASLLRGPGAPHTAEEREDLLDRIFREGAGPRKLLCSGLVTLAYQVAGSQLSLDPATTLPARATRAHTERLLDAVQRPDTGFEFMGFLPKKKE